ncbi:MAG: hypothetical protein PHI53_00375 [Candidatus Pacebacteria bacterium]|nr:hypothetical protein [Candidatus Paceibacterota bacterium]
MTSRVKTLALSNNLSVLFFNTRIILSIFYILSLFIFSGLLIFYVFQVSAEASERYQVEDYQKKLNEISKEEADLEIVLMNGNSLDNVVTLASELNFEKIDKIHYVRVLENKVVAK